VTRSREVNRSGAPAVSGFVSPHDGPGVDGGPGVRPGASQEDGLGNEDGVGRFVAARSAALLWFAHALTGDEARARDAVEAAIADVAVRHKLSRSPRPGRSDANNLDDEALRRVVRHVLDTAMTAAKPSEIASDPSEPEAEPDDQTLTWQALSTLPPRQRVALTLASQGLSASEAADMAGCRRRTVEADADAGLANVARDLGEPDASRALGRVAAVAADPRRKLDPLPGMADRARERARARRRRRSLVVAASVAAVTLVIAGAVVDVRMSSRSTSAKSPAPSEASPPPLPFAAPQGALSLPVTTGEGWASGLAIDGRRHLYALTHNPAQVVELSPVTAAVEATAPAPPGTPSGIVFGEKLVWAWSRDTGDVSAYDPTTLATRGSLSSGVVILNAAATAGKLWLATDHGLFTWTPGDTGLRQPHRRTADADGSVYAIAADPARRRVLLGVTPNGSTAPYETTGPDGVVYIDGARIDAIDTVTGEVTRGAKTSYVNESIAVVGDDIWVGGYSADQTPGVEHLDATTLQVIGTSPVQEKVSPTLLWPGANVLWVGNGGFLFCVNPATGAVLEQWPSFQGPVASAQGIAYGIGGGTRILNLTGACTG